MDELTDREVLLLTAERVKRIDDALPELTHRVTKLEAWRNFLSGAGAVLTSLFGGHLLGGPKHP